MEMGVLKSATSLLVTDVLFSFCSYICEVVCIYYKDDEAVQHDKEIQAFVQDVRDFGMQNFDQCGEVNKDKNSAVQIIAALTEFVFLSNRVFQMFENPGGTNNLPDRGYIHGFCSTRRGQLWTGQIPTTKEKDEVDLKVFLKESFKSLTWVKALILEKCTRQHQTLYLRRLIVVHCAV